MLVSHILCEARPPAYFVRDVLCIWRFTWPAVVHIATWHWDWTCTSSLFNNGMDSMSRTRLFILNLILANIIWYLLATHVHVFFPSMVCASQEHWPCGYLLHVFESYYFYDLFVWLAIASVNDLLHLIDHFYDAKLFAIRSFFFSFLWFY